MKRLRDAAGKVVAEDCEMAAIAKHHFEKNSRQTAEIATEEGMNLDSPHRERLNQEQVERLEKPFSYIEVMEAVKRMKRGKGVGIDKISSEMLVGGGEILWRNLTALFNVCWKEEFVPFDWMEGIVIPLHKGGDKCDITNYREITLGSHVGKLFCSVLNARLSEAMYGAVRKYRVLF